MASATWSASPPPARRKRDRGDRHAAAVRITSPARREREHVAGDGLRGRITSACAERTTGGAWACRCTTHHLRLRGENWPEPSVVPPRAASPPPARRERTAVTVHHVGERITSACAERTTRRTPRESPSAHHLRLRGENTARPSPAGLIYASPPPARRELGQRGELLPLGRITSACAERTPGPPTSPPATAHHLRLRGENRIEAIMRGPKNASPPPARRERQVLALACGRHRITSACAERTAPSPGPWPVRPHHLRLRGENIDQSCPGGVDDASPPPARREREFAADDAGPRRITSACAERTRPRRWPRARAAHHLRLRGENSPDRK